MLDGFRPFCTSACCRKSLHLYLRSMAAEVPQANGYGKTSLWCALPIVASGLTCADSWLIYPLHGQADRELVISNLLQPNIDSFTSSESKEVLFLSQGRSSRRRGGWWIWSYREAAAAWHQCRLILPMIMPADYGTIAEVSDMNGLTLSTVSSWCFAGDIKKAKEAGYHTCQSLLMQTKKVHLMMQLYV